MKNCSAVIGANGFLGRYIMKALINEGNNVIAVYNKSCDKIQENVVLQSIEDFLISDYVPKNIYFCVGNYTSDHTTLVEINQLLYRISKKFTTSKIIYISSTNVYGFQSNLISINSAFNNPSLYAISKIVGEFITSSHEKFAILRLTYLYGIGLENNSFIPKLISTSEEHGKITVFGDGSRLQDYLHVEDAALLCLTAAKLNTNEILLGATGNSISNTNVAKAIQACTDCEIIYTGIESGTSFRFDIEHTLTKTTWMPTKLFEKEIKKMIN